jgi:hypothetical protein
MAKSSEPLSEDDYSDDQIVSFKPFELEGDKISFNCIREEGKAFFRPLNVQLESTDKSDTLTGNKK